MSQEARDEGDENVVRFCRQQYNPNRPANQHVPYIHPNVRSIEDMYKKGETVTTDNFNEIIVKIGSKDSNNAIKIDIDGAYMMHTDYKTNYDIGIIVPKNNIQWNSEHYPDQYVAPICLPKRYVFLIFPMYFQMFP